MIRRPQAQWFTFSTAGDETSIYLLEQVRRGRHLVESGRESRTAYFEWSVPLDADIDDPEVLQLNMPALGFGISLEDVMADRDGMPDFEFRRAYGNQWTEGLHSADAVVGPADWKAVRDPESRYAGESKLRMSIDVAPDGSVATVGKAGFRDDGLMMLEAQKTDAGMSWVVAQCKLMADNQPRYENTVVVDTSTPAAALIPALEDAGLIIEPISGADWNAACASFFDAATSDHSIRHIDDPVLNNALASAGQSFSESGWHWKRRGEKPITPLCAVTLARWALVKASGDDGYDPLASFF
jgi:hypothetical protein